ncbi:unnamed protein product, partial [marine sediment metagenome]
IGDNNLFMAFVHIAHDCVVGDHVTMANLASLCGHVVVEDRAALGGMAGIHQHVVIGTMGFVAGCSKVVKDALPYMIVDGNPARCPGLNIVGLTRNGVSESSRRALKDAYRVLCRSSLNIAQAIEKVEEEVENCSEVAHLVEFVRASQRGITK